MSSEVFFQNPKIYYSVSSRIQLNILRLVFPINLSQGKLIHIEDVSTYNIFCRQPNGIRSFVSSVRPLLTEAVLKDSWKSELPFPYQNLFTSTEVDK